MVRTGAHGVGVNLDSRNLRPYAVRVKDPVSQTNKLIGMFDTKEEAQACADKALMTRFVKYGVHTRLNREDIRYSLLEEVVNIVHNESEESGDNVNYHYHNDPDLRAMVRVYREQEVFGEDLKPDLEQLDMAIADTVDPEQLLKDLDDFEIELSVVLEALGEHAYLLFE